MSKSKVTKNPVDYRQEEVIPPPSQPDDLITLDEPVYNNDKSDDEDCIIHSNEDIHSVDYSFIEEKREKEKREKKERENIEMLPDDYFIVSKYSLLQLLSITRGTIQFSFLFTI